MASKKTAKKGAKTKAKKASAKALPMKRPRKAKREQIELPLNAVVSKYSDAQQKIDHIVDGIVEATRAGLAALQQVPEQVSRLCSFLAEVSQVPDPTSKAQSWDEKLEKCQGYYSGTACAEAAEQLGIARLGYQFVAFKYLFRVGNKPGDSAEADLKSAEWYLTRLVEVYPDIVNEELFGQLVDQLEELKKEHGIVDESEAAE